MIFVYSALIAIIVIAVVFVVAVNNFKNPAPKNKRFPSHEGMEYEQKYIPTKNKRKLFSWWVPSQNSEATIILMHGWGKNASVMMPYIKHLNAGGFNVIAFDSRNHGDSDKDNYSSMLKFAEDISACVDFAKAEKQEQSQKIYLLGLSIGGAASIYAASNDKRVDKIITVGAPSNPADVMRLHLRNKKIPNSIISLVFKYLELKVGKRFLDICAANNIAKTKAQVFLVHGEIDKVVPIEQAGLINNASNKGQSQLWKIPGKGHNNCHYENGFWTRLLAFLDN